LSNLEKTRKIVRPPSENADVSRVERPSENQPSRIYLKAMPLRTLSDLDTIRREVESDNILILKVTPLASKSIKDIKKAVNELCEFVKAIDGDIARLGEERIVITPSGVRIWREKTAAPKEQVPTAA
jgi:SepF-like predicted cell division protein (DUF552 family)